MDILITDYYCASNRGDAAILEGVVNGLRREYPSANLTAMTEHPDAASIIHDIPAIEQNISPFIPRNPFRGAALAMALTYAKTGIPFPGLKTVKERLSLQPYHEADLVVSTGGQFITDPYFPGKLGVMAEFMYCDMIGVPVAVFAQSLGPFTDTPFGSIIRAALNTVDVITTRDQLSVEYLQQLGVTDPPIYSCADAAFLLPNKTPPDSIPRPVMEDVGVLEHGEGPLISISVRRWNQFERGSLEGYYEAVAQAAEELVRSHDAQIIFASTCTGLDGYHNDDRIPAYKVWKNMDEEARISADILTGEYTPHELVTIYSQMDAHIGTRMHSNILAMLGGTVPVPIEYEFKTTGLFQHLGLEDYVMDIDGIAAGQIVATTLEMLRTKDEMEERIVEGREMLEEKAAHAPRLISTEVNV